MNSMSNGINQLEIGGNVIYLISYLEYFILLPLLNLSKRLCRKEMILFGGMLYCTQRNRGMC